MKDRMLSGQLYHASDPRLVAEGTEAQLRMERFNATSIADPALRTRLLRELLREVGEGAVVRPPLYVDYGRHIRLGAGTFVNYGAVMLDVTWITIGAFCQIAPNVQLLTATHPVDPGPRRDGWESGLPITLGDNVWLGGGVIVCPGVSIGNDTVVGAGAVVIRDLPAGVVAVGNPARVLRPISERDRVEVPKLRNPPPGGLPHAG